MKIGLYSLDQSHRGTPGSGNQESSTNNPLKFGLEKKKKIF